MYQALGSIPSNRQKPGVVEDTCSLQTRQMKEESDDISVKVMEGIVGMSVQRRKGNIKGSDRPGQVRQTVLVSVQLLRRDARHGQCNAYKGKHFIVALLTVSEASPLSPW